jgi:localization factor PodJL
MKFGVSWGSKKMRPEARETAKEAARRAGMPLEDWLDSVVLRQAQQDGIGVRAPVGERGEVADVNQRLDDLTRRIEQLTRGGPAAYAPRRKNGEPDLSGSPPLVPPMPHAPAPSQLPSTHLPSMHLPPALDHAVAEIAARRRALNGDPAYANIPQPAPQAPPPMPVAAPAPLAARPTPPPAPPSAAPQAPLPSQNLSGLENQLRRITDQIETLRKPGIEEAINALRQELNDISRALADAMPRNAIEAIEKQILEVALRIDEGRQAGVDQQSLTRVEHGLAEVRDALHGLRPAESLIGFNEAVASLAHKIDLIVAQKDPATIEQLEHAITTLRGMAEHVASNETVTQIANEVVMLGEKIDYIARATTGGNGAGADVISTLDQRVSAIADALGAGAQGSIEASPRLEAMVQSLGEKIEQIQTSRGDTGAVGHLEQRIASLVDRLDASQSRLGQLETIERGLNDLLAHMEEMRASKAADGAQAGQAPAVADLKVNMDRTQDALEAVHDTLGHVVDRLAMIEKEFRNKERRIVPNVGEADLAPDLPAELPPSIGRLAVRAVTQTPAEPPMPRAVPAPAAPAAAAAAPAPLAAAEAPVLPPVTEKSAPHAALQAAPQAAPPAPRTRAPVSPVISSDGSDDQPIEPGSGRPKFSARIAASEAALGGALPSEAASGGKSSFIAAARRAAQTAMQQGGRPPEPRGEPVLELTEESQPSLRAKVMKRMKSVFIAASIIAVVVGGFQIAGNWLKFAETLATDTDKRSNVEPEKSDPAAIEEHQAPEGEPDTSGSQQQLKTKPPLAKPPAMAPRSELEATPSLFNPPILGAPPAASLPQPPATQAKNDATGSIPDTAHQKQPASEEAPADKDRLPAAVGSARLRNAALAGDPGAAYEVAVRFAEGHGVQGNMTEAAYWFALAAGRGLVPAQFRYASMLEKGQGVKKDQGRARELYLAAAAKGNAKAMHNLAVLYAEGIDGKPDYAAAVKWFRQAAAHGIADSQYNLGVLTARGFGTDKDFGASYKWFALAAAQGDQESAKKRDEIASHLDASALAAAQQSVQTFAAEPQPKAATFVPKPQGGWDNADTPAGAAKRKATSEQLLPSAPLPLGSFTLGKR